MKFLRHAFCLCLLLFTVTGCVSFSDAWNVIIGKSAPRVTRSPVWVYQPDLAIWDGVRYSPGVVKLPIAPKMTIYMESLVSADRLVVWSCARYNVCAVRGGSLACDPKLFKVEKNWFSSPGKHAEYTFRPNELEYSDSCSNLFIEVYSKDALVSWGYVYFEVRPEEHFPGHFACNEKQETNPVASVCANKARNFSYIKFDVPIFTYRADKECNAEKVSDKEFKFRPDLGWCRASFGADIDDQLKFHDVIINAFDESFIRD